MKKKVLSVKKPEQATRSQPYNCLFDLGIERFCSRSGMRSQFSCQLHFVRNLERGCWPGLNKLDGVPCPSSAWAGILTLYAQEPPAPTARLDSFDKCVFSVYCTNKDADG